VRSPTFTKSHKLLSERTLENEPLKHRRFAYRIHYVTVSRPALRG
jgi:hypothetical protein